MTPGIGPKQLEGVILSLTWQIFIELLLSTEHCLGI